MIRAYTDNDFSAIEAIYLRCKPREFANEQVEITIVPLQDDPVRLEEFQASDIYVYEQDVVVAFATITDNHIGWLYVLPEYHRQGIGAALLSFIIQQFEGQLVTLATTRSNHAALSLYAKYRFDIIQESTVLVQGSKVDICRLGHQC